MYDLNSKHYYQDKQLQDSMQLEIKALAYKFEKNQHLDMKKLALSENNNKYSVFSRKQSNNLATMLLKVSILIAFSSLLYKSTLINAISTANIGALDFDASEIEQTFVTAKATTGAVKTSHLAIPTKKFHLTTLNDSESIIMRANDTFTDKNTTDQETGAEIKTNPLTTTIKADELTLTTLAPVVSFTNSDKVQGRNLDNSQQQSEDNSRIEIDSNRRMFDTHEQMVHENASSSYLQQQQQQQQQQQNRIGMSKVSRVSSLLSDFLAYATHPNYASSSKTSTQNPTTSTTPETTSPDDQSAQEIECPGVCRSIIAASILCQVEINGRCPSLFQRCCNAAPLGATLVETSAPMLPQIHQSTSELPTITPEPVPVEPATQQSATVVTPIASIPLLRKQTILNETVPAQPEIDRCIDGTVESSTMNTSDEDENKAGSVYFLSSDPNTQIASLAPVERRKIYCNSSSTKQLNGEPENVSQSFDTRVNQPQQPTQSAGNEQLQIDTTTNTATTTTTTTTTTSTTQAPSQQTTTSTTTSTTTATPSISFSGQQDGSSEEPQAGTSVLKDVFTMLFDTLAASSNNQESPEPNQQAVLDIGSSNTFPASTQLSPPPQPEEVGVADGEQRAPSLNDRRVGYEAPSYLQQQQQLQQRYRPSVEGDLIASSSAVEMPPIESGDTSVTSTATPSQGPCRGFCAMSIFSLLCDSSYQSDDCGASQKCCVTGISGTSNPTTSSSDVRHPASETCEQDGTCRQLPVNQTEAISSDLLAALVPPPPAGVSFPKSLVAQQQQHAHDPVTSDLADRAQQTQNQDRRHQNSAAAALAATTLPLIIEEAQLPAVMLAFQQQQQGLLSGTNNGRPAMGVVTEASSQQRPSVSSLWPLRNQQQQSTSATAPSGGIMSQIYSIFRPNLASKTPTTSARPTASLSRPLLSPFGPQLANNPTQQYQPMVASPSLVVPSSQYPQQRLPSAYDTYLSNLAAHAAQQQKIAGNSRQPQLISNGSYIPQLSAHHQQQQFLAQNQQAQLPQQQYHMQLQYQQQQQQQQQQQRQHPQQQQQQLHVQPLLDRNLRAKQQQQNLQMLRQQPWHAVANSGQLELDTGIGGQQIQAAQLQPQQVRISANTQQQANQAQLQQQYQLQIQQQQLQQQQQQVRRKQVQRPAAAPVLQIESTNDPSTVSKKTKTPTPVSDKRRPDTNEETKRQVANNKLANEADKQQQQQQQQQQQLDEVASGASSVSVRVTHANTHHNNQQQQLISMSLPNSASLPNFVTPTATTTTTTTTTSRTPFVANTVRAQPQCGLPIKQQNRNNKQQRRGRIVGGSDVFDGDFCWNAALLNDRSEYMCGGTLIGDRWVLTAGHCVSEYMRNNSLLLVRLGQRDLTSNGGNSGKTVVVNTTYIHHNFNNTSLDNDIALLRLDSTVPLNSGHSLTYQDSIDSSSSDQQLLICAACLPQRGAEPQIGKSCSVTGFGSSSENGPAMLTLQQISVPIVDLGVCQAKASEVVNGPLVLPANSFCAGGIEGIDTCNGDGGSPLVCSDESGLYEITGIVSWGYKCGTEVPSVYTRVSSFIGWINQIVSVNN